MAVVVRALRRFPVAPVRLLALQGVVHPLREILADVLRNESSVTLT